MYALDFPKYRFQILESKIRIFYLAYITKNFDLQSAPKIKPIDVLSEYQINFVFLVSNNNIIPEFLVGIREVATNALDST